MRLDFTPDGRLAVVSDTDSNNVSIIDTQARKVTATVDVGAAPKRLVAGSVNNAP